MRFDLRAIPRNRWDKSDAAIALRTGEMDWLQPDCPFGGAELYQKMVRRFDENAERRKRIPINYSILNARRLSLGLSLQRLAKQAGVRDNTCSRIEQGKVAPRWDHLERIASALD